MFVFVHAKSIKTVHAGGGGVKKWQNSVHVAVEWPLTEQGETYRLELKIGSIPNLEKITILFHLSRLST